MEPRGPAAELVYETLERKRPPRPTPAPRTSLVPESGEKPQIPERPATLQRPLSSSFRHSRNLDTHSHTESDVSSIQVLVSSVYQHRAIRESHHFCPEPYKMNFVHPINSYGLKLTSLNIFFLLDNNVILY